MVPTPRPSPAGDIRTHRLKTRPQLSDPANKQFLLSASLQTARRGRSAIPRATPPSLCAAILLPPSGRLAWARLAGCKDIVIFRGGCANSTFQNSLIADSVEYMVNAHCADAMVCISNCDKITPGMLMAALRLNVPTIFVSGGPMEAGKVVLHTAMDLVDAMVAAADDRVSDEDVKVIERSACPTCGSCSGMFTANSMNCLTEALGLSLPGNGSTLATHAARKGLFVEAAHLIVDLTRRHYSNRTTPARRRARSPTSPPSRTR